MSKPLTFSEWLSKECSLTVEQLYLVSLDYGEDSEVYIEDKELYYNAYLRNHGKEISQ